MMNAKSNVWKAVITAVIIISTLGTTFCFTEGYFPTNKAETKETKKSSQELVLSTEKPENTVAPTATPTPTVAKVQKAKLGEKQVLLGRELDLIKYLESLSDQEWLALATVGESYYSRVKDGDVIVAIDGKEVNAFENALTSEKISVLRCGNAFCVEPKEGEIAEDMSEKVPTMSDAEIYKEGFCGEHVALRSNATTATSFPKAVNMPGSLSQDKRYNPQVLKALVLVKYQATDADGRELEVYAIAWKVCDCTGLSGTSSKKNKGGGSGSSGKPDNSKPGEKPTKGPENNSEPKADPTRKPTDSLKPENNSEPKADPTPRTESGNSSKEEPVKKSETVASSGNSGNSSSAGNSGSSGNSSSEKKADPTPKTSEASDDAPVKKNEEW